MAIHPQCSKQQVVVMQKKVAKFLGVTLPPRHFQRVLSATHVTLNESDASESIT